MLNYIRDDSCYIFGFRIPDGVKCASLYEYAIANFIRRVKEGSEEGKGAGKGKGRGTGKRRKWNKKDGEANTDGQFQFDSVTQMHNAIGEGCCEKLASMSNKTAKALGLLKYKKLFARGKEWAKEFVCIVFSKEGKARNGGNNHAHRAKQIQEVILDELLERTLPPQEKPVIMQCKSASKELRTFNDRYAELVNVMDDVKVRRATNMGVKDVEEDAGAVDAPETDE